MWDTLSGNLIHTFEGHLAGVSTIAWSPDCATIASGSDDKTIRLWNVLTVRFTFFSYLEMDNTDTETGKSTPRPLRRPPQLRLPDRLLPQRQHARQRIL